MSLSLSIYPSITRPILLCFFLSIYLPVHLSTSSTIAPVDPAIHVCHFHAYKFSSSIPRLPSFSKLPQNPHVQLTFVKVQNPLRVPLPRPQAVRTWCAFHILASKCASRHNSMSFFDISTSKSGPRPSVFNKFHFETSFPPQRSARFQHLRLQKWSEHGAPGALLLRNALRVTTACTFHTTEVF